MRDNSDQIKGDCFVWANTEGLVWNGETWVEAWPDGLRFYSPTSAYEDCAAAGEQAGRMTGKKGFCWYIQRGASQDMRLGPTRGFDHFPPIPA